MMRILSFDPGSRETGWCEIASSKERPVVLEYVASGTVASARPDVAELIALRDVDVIAVEVLAGIAYPVKGAGIVGALIASSNAAGMIAALGFAAGVKVVEMTARDWRGVVCGKPHASDKTIAETVPRLVRAWPKRSNVHARDAAGLAIAVAWRMAAERRSA